MHYAGVACEMDAIMDNAARYGLKVVEDAAQGVMSAIKVGPEGPLAILAVTRSMRPKTSSPSMGEGETLADPRCGLQ